MSDKTEKVIVVVGPTASGKTSLGVALAKSLDGEVVSCDSMQIYKGMPIASAAPTEDETQGIPHHLVGFKDPTEKFSVADFVELASKKVSEIAARGHKPILVGGTGLYIDSLVSGVSFCDEDNTEVRAKFEAEADENGVEVLLERLKKIDPQTASKYHVNDRKRIIRALEIFEIHKKTKTELDLESKLKGDRYDALWIGITYRDRDILYNRINKRVDIMLQNGLLQEAKNAFDSGFGSTAVQAIGHKEFFPYFKGEISLDLAIENLKMETRRYAKRQLTWFRRNEKINWIYADETPDVVTEAKKIICKKELRLR